MTNQLVLTIIKFQKTNVLGKKNQFKHFFLVSKIKKLLKKIPKERPCITENPCVRASGVNELNSKFSCEKGGEERLIEEKRNEVDNHSCTPKFRMFLI